NFRRPESARPSLDPRACWPARGCRKISAAHRSRSKFDRVVRRRDRRFPRSKSCRALSTQSPSRRTTFKSAADLKASPGAWSISAPRTVFAARKGRAGTVTNHSTPTTGAQAQAAMNGIAPRSKRKKAARKRIKRARDPEKQSSQRLQPRTAEDIANEQTVEQLALRIWATMVAKDALSAMSVLIDELIQSYSLDDDDEEADESELDAHKK